MARSIRQDDGVDLLREMMSRIEQLERALKFLGVQHARADTPSIAAGGTAAVVVTWPNAFPNANYTAVPGIEDDANGLEVRRFSKTADAITVTVANTSGAPQQGTVNAVSIADRDES